MKKKEFDELVMEANRLKAEGFICKVRLDCLFNLGNREKLTDEYLRLIMKGDK